MVDPGRPEGTAFSVQAIHALRTAQNNTLRLSQMADQKASILMGATFLVFSIAVGRSLAGDLPWPLAILAAFAFLSSLCAATAIMPSIGKPRGGGRRNMLFFGHFYDREEEEWTLDVLGELHTDETVLRLMLDDIYQNGQVLQRRKYRYLGYAYRLFIVGLGATLGAFAWELAARGLAA